MKLLYTMEREVVYSTGRWAIKTRSYGNTLYFEVYKPSLFGVIKRKFWVDTDDLFEVNECNSNG